MTSYAIPLAGDTYNYLFDTMGRAKELTKTGSSYSPVKDVLYSAGGQMTQIKYLGGDRWGQRPRLPIRLSWRRGVR
jgi:hypothetical protein